jgi:hypothetical protein
MSAFISTANTSARPGSEGQLLLQVAASNCPASSGAGLVPGAAVTVHNLAPTGAIPAPAAVLIDCALQRAGYTVRRHPAGYIAIVGGQTR